LRMADVMSELEVTSLLGWDGHVLKWCWEGRHVRDRALKG
jgi:hypothetical protein